MGARVLPPSAGSPWRRRCSATRRERFLRVAAWAGRGRRDNHLDIARLGDRKHAKAEPAAEIAIARVALASLATLRQSGGEPDFVTGGRAIDRLQNQFEVEGKLQFADHHDRGIVAAQRDKVAAADFALDREAELLEETFDGQIKRGFQGGSRYRGLRLTGGV